MHSVFVDSDDHVWLTGTGTGDGQMLKFTRDGTFMLQVGTAGQATRGSPQSNDPDNLNAATGVAEYAPTKEIFVSDGYGNRRVIVFDAENGWIQAALGRVRQSARRFDPVDVRCEQPKSTVQHPPRHRRQPGRLRSTSPIETIAAFRSSASTEPTWPRGSSSRTP